jgi:hypothetical protein
LTNITEQYIHDKFQKRDWLTPGLIKEVNALHPTKDHINSSNGEHDKTTFEENCNILFAPGRIFASSYQLTQVAKLFLDAWAVIGISQGSKKIVFHCHKGVTRKTIPIDDPPGLSRDVGATLKDQYLCLKIHFTFNRRRHHHMKPLSFYHVWITFMNAKHTCTLDSNFHRWALQRGGRLKHDLDGMKSILLLLQE